MQQVSVRLVSVRNPMICATQCERAVGALASLGVAEGAHRKWVRDPVDRDHCPGRKPPFWAVKRPARPYKSPTQNGFAQGDAKGA
jgi:hypothetical protein